jgi:hypothetical protein
MAAGPSIETDYLLLEVEGEPGEEIVEISFGGMKRGWLTLDPERIPAVDDGLYLMSPN